ncbi:MAG: dihydrodipicolinate reductase [Desulfobacteraceae bacterium 4572_130]|nr:MAG: dihydrodipicolinate reductase [Desulfobacteraceae bacterium 4572_130]
MEKINIMINGIPGNVAVIIAKNAITDNRFQIIPFSLTGPEIKDKKISLNNIDIKLIKPDEKDNIISEIKKDFKEFIAIDYSHPTAVNLNAEFYVKHSIPFVMGTTGGDRKKLEKTVLQGSNPAVIAPNMVKQIVGFQAMFEYAAKTFPDLFKGYSLIIKESHQKEKFDTSGTAKAMVKYYNELGIPFKENEIIKERNPETQRKIWEIPEQHLQGHGWHTYTLTSPDKSACFEFKHNINGRDIYVDGTLDGVVFLHKKLKTEKKGKIFTMIDVLKG